MATKVYGFYGLTGGANGSLDKLDGSVLNGGDIAVVVTSTATYVYRLDASNNNSEVSPYIISPDSNAGTKRWVLSELRGGKNAEGDVVYYPDATEADHGAASTPGDRTIKDFIDAASGDPITIHLTHVSGANTDYVVDTDEVMPSSVNLIIDNGARISAAAGDSLTIQGPIDAGDYHIFTGSGIVYIENNFRRPVEWFGAVGDGATNDYTPFLKALQSNSTQNNAAHITWDASKLYVLNNGANPAIDLDCETLPDGTDATGWDQESKPTYLLGSDAPPVSPTDVNLPEVGLKITGTGTGINIENTTGAAAGKHSWRGHIHLSNISIDGNNTCTLGINIDACNRGCTFSDILIKNCDGNGLELGEVSTYSMYFSRIYSYYNTGWGAIFDGNAYHIESIYTEYNGGGGIRIGRSGGTPQANSVKVVSCTSQYNVIPQVLITTAANVSINGLYLESQDANANGSEVNGVDHGLIELGSGTETLYNISIKNVYVTKATPTGAAQIEQFTFYKDANIYGLTIDNVFVGDDFTNGTNSVYMFNDSTAFTTSQMYASNLYFSPGNLDGMWENNAAHDEFMESSSHLSTVNTVQLRQVCNSFCITWYIENATDNTANQTLTFLPAGGVSQTWRSPYDLAITAVSFSSNLGAGSVTITDANSSYSQATSALQEQFRYDLDDYTLNDNTAFVPKVSVTGAGGTPDIHVTFFFSVVPHDQDRIS